MRTMNRKASIIVIGILLVGLAVAQPQQSQQLMDPGHKPGDLLYSIDRLGESLTRAVASAPVIGSEEMRAKVMANQAEERLSEAQSLANENRSEEASRLMDEYQENLNRSTAYARNVNSSELESRLENVTSKHVDVLDEVEKKVPEQAKEAIRRAKDNAEKSNEGLRKAREARERAQSGAPGNSADRLPTGKEGKTSNIPEGDRNTGSNLSKPYINLSDSENTIPDWGNDSNPLDSSNDSQRNNLNNTGDIGPTGGATETVPGIGNSEDNKDNPISSDSAQNSEYRDKPDIDIPGHQR